MIMATNLADRAAMGSGKFEMLKVFKKDKSYLLQIEPLILYTRHNTG